MAHAEEPFFIEIGFHEPHSPFWYPVEFAKRYDPKNLHVSDPGPEDAGQIPKIFAELTREDKQGIIASYYTSVAFLDLNVGRVLSAMEELNLADNTIVVYLGDNGYHLGEHGRFEKHSFFERAVRIPLLMSFPGRIRSGMSTKALVEGVDLVPTVLDYCGLLTEANPPPERALHGLSLKRLIDGEVTRVRDAVFSEYQPTQEVMVRSERHKLIYHTGSPSIDWLGYEPVEPPTGRTVRLYDLEADPDEMHNLVDDPANGPVVSAMFDQLVEWYHKIPPLREKPPENLSRPDFLDWAIAPRNVPSTRPAGSKPK
jgi:choline-sulfatase